MNILLIKIVYNNIFFFISALLFTLVENVTKVKISMNTTIAKINIFKISFYLTIVYVDESINSNLYNFMLIVKYIHMLIAISISVFIMKSFVFKIHYDLFLFYFLIFFSW